MFLMLAIAGGILIAVAILVVVALAGLAISANWDECAGWFGVAFVVVLLWAAVAYVGLAIVAFFVCYIGAIVFVQSGGIAYLRRMVRRG